MGENKLKFGDLCISYCLLNMFSHGWLVGYYCNENAIVPIEEEYPGEFRSYFDKCKKVIPYNPVTDKERETFKLLSEEGMDKLKAFVDHMENRDKSKDMIINEPIQIC